MYFVLSEKGSIDLSAGSLFTPFSILGRLPGLQLSYFKTLISLPPSAVKLDYADGHISTISARVPKTLIRNAFYRSLLVKELEVINSSQDLSRNYT